MIRSRWEKSLMKQAALNREGKGNVRPSSVEVFRREDGLMVVYVFPLSGEIAAKDGLIRCKAQIGRIALAQHFDP
jgi:hypothetical protein